MSTAYHIDTTPELELSIFWEGDAFVEHAEGLHRLYERLGMKTHDQFLCHDDEEKRFSPDAGLKYFTRLAKEVDANEALFADEGAAVLAAIEDLVTLLGEVKAEKARWALVLW
jgi:hypothetical protein